MNRRLSYSHHRAGLCACPAKVAGGVRRWDRRDLLSKTKESPAIQPGSLRVMHLLQGSLIAACQVLCDGERFVFKLVAIDLKVFCDALHVVPCFGVRD